MSKYLLKFIKYIFPSSEDWTGVGHLSYRDVYLHHTSISRVDILSIELVLKLQTQLQQRLTTKVPSVMWIFRTFGRKPNIDCWACWSSVTAKNIFVPVLTEGFCSGFVHLKLACIMALGEDRKFSSRWMTEATAKVETEGETWHSWVVWSMMIVMMD